MKNLQVFLTRLMATFGVISFCNQVTAGVIVDGREWLQPNAFFETWNNLSAACPDGECAGLVGRDDKVDVTGFRWASASEVDDLFTSFIGTRDPVNNDATLGYLEAGSTWAPAFLASFQATSVTSVSSSVRAWTSNFNNLNLGVTAIVFDVFDDTQNDRATVKTFLNRNSSIGAWLYRDVQSTSNPVPVTAPTTLALLGLGLLSLRLRRKA